MTANPFLRPTTAKALSEADVRRIMAKDKRASLDATARVIATLITEITAPLQKRIAELEKALGQAQAEVADALSRDLDAFANPDDAETEGERQAMRKTIEFHTKRKGSGS